MGVFRHQKISMSCIGYYTTNFNTLIHVTIHFTDTKKAWESCLSLVPRIEAFALPVKVERATQKPTQYAYMIILSTPRHRGAPSAIRHTHRHLPLLYS